MDPDRRIRELESQVERLTGMVTELMAQRDEAHAAALHAAPQEAGPGEVLPETAPLEAHPRHKRPESAALVEQVRQRMDHVLGGDSPELLEARIGAVWLSRLAVVALMTALALGARMVFDTDAIGPAQKVAIGYVLAVAFTAYGFIAGRREDFFAEALLGCGLACLYFTTYAAFFIDQMRIVDQLPFTAPIRIALISGCLVLLILAAHWRRSQTVAGLGLFLAYYTVVVSCTQSPTVENLAHAFLTSGILAAAALFFHFLHRWLFFSWAALVGSHLTYIVFLLRMPQGLELSQADYFWISNGFLTGSYLLFSLACVSDARKTGEYRRTVAPLSGVNSAVYLTLTYFAVREHFPEQQWMFRAGVGTVLLALAILAETTGPRRNYLFQIYIAKTVILYTMALQAYLASRGEILLVAMSIECLALSFSYHRSGIVAFKVLGLGLGAVTFTACLLALKMAGSISWGGYTVPANWFSAVGVALFFQLIAWYYERFVRPLKPEQRVTSGQWFMADTALDLRSATMAIVHAAGGALILLAITIVELDDDPALPFVLAGEAAMLGGLGLILRTPQIEVASLLMGVAGHLCFYAFLWMPMAGFQEQRHFAAATGFLAGFTYLGAYAWERYLRRFKHPRYAWEHHLVAAVPYLSATLLLAILIRVEIIPVGRPAVQALMGMLLLFAGVLTRYPGLRASGVLALGMAVQDFYFCALYEPTSSIARTPHFMRYFALFLAMLALSERCLARLQRLDGDSFRIENALRTVFAGTLVVLGALGLHQWAPENRYPLYLLSLAVAAILFGALCRERRYRWGALFLFAVVLVRAYVYFQKLPPLYQIATFGALALVLLAVSWGYSRILKRRRKQAEMAAPPPVQRTNPDA